MSKASSSSNNSNSSENNSSTDHTLALPFETLALILHKHALPNATDRHNAARVCRRWRSARWSAIASLKIGSSKKRQPIADAEKEFHAIAQHFANFPPAVAPQQLRTLDCSIVTDKAENALCIIRPFARTLRSLKLTPIYLKEPSELPLLFDGVTTMCTALTHLDASGNLPRGTESTPLLHACATTLTRLAASLESLAVGQCALMGDERLRVCSTLTKLQALNLSLVADGARNTIAHLNALPTSLQRLGLCTWVRLRSLDGIAHLHDLRVLDLRYCPSLSSDSLCALARAHPRLEKLLLLDVQDLNDEFMSTLLENCTNLQLLDVRVEQPTDIDARFDADEIFASVPASLRELRINIVGERPSELPDHVQLLPEEGGEDAEIDDFPDDEKIVC